MTEKKEQVKRAVRLKNLNLRQPSELSSSLPHQRNLRAWKTVWYLGTTLILAFFFITIFMFYTTRNDFNCVLFLSWMAFSGISLLYFIILKRARRVSLSTNAGHITIQYLSRQKRKNYWTVYISHTIRSLGINIFFRVDVLLCSSYWRWSNNIVSSNISLL